MKVLMKEHYRDAENVFAQGDTVEVGSSLGAWLVEHGKASEIKPEPKPEPKPAKKAKDEITQD